MGRKSTRYQSRQQSKTQNPDLRLLHKVSERGSSIARAAPSRGGQSKMGRRGPASGSADQCQRLGARRLRLGEAGTPQLEQVVGGGDQLPFGLTGA